MPLNQELLNRLDRQKQQASTGSSIDQARSALQNSLGKAKENANQMSSYRKNLASSMSSQIEMPTYRDMLTDVYTTFQKDPERASDMYSQLIEARKDPSSFLCNNYSTSTSKAAKSLQDMGYDTSAVDDNWFAQNSWMANDEATAPFYGAMMEDEQRTQEAERETAALDEELAWWANQDNLNLSDDEIIGRIDMSKYPTLQEMDKTRGGGQDPLGMNRPLAYSDGWMRGRLWAARNDGGTGNSESDMINSVLGVGNVWQDKPEIRAKLDPSDPNYSPYSAGTTMYNAALYFGVKEFPDGWVEEHSDLANSSDLTEREYYLAVADAQRTTDEAKAELEDLRAKVDARLTFQHNPDKAAKYVQALMDTGAYPVLASMQKSIRTGNGLVDLTQAVDFKQEDIEQYARSVCELNASVKSGDTAIAEFNPNYSEDAAPDPTLEGIRRTEQTENERIGDAVFVMEPYMTDSEKNFFMSASNRAFERYREDIRGKVLNPDAWTPEFMEYNGKRCQAVNNEAYKETAFGSMQLRDGYELLQADQQSLQDQKALMDEMYGPALYAGFELNPHEEVAITGANGDTFSAHIYLEEDPESGTKRYVDRSAENPNFSIVLQNNGITEEEYQKQIQEALQDRNDFVDKVLAAKEAYPEWKAENPETELPKQEEIELLERRIARVDKLLADGKADYDQATKKLGRANDRRQQVASFMLENGLEADDYSQTDADLAVISWFAVPRVPQAGTDSAVDVIMWDTSTIDGKKPGEYADTESYKAAHREWAKQQVESIDSNISSINQLKETYPNIPEDYIANMDGEIAYLESLKRAYGYADLVNDERYDSWIERGKTVDSWLRSMSGSEAGEAHGIYALTDMGLFAKGSMTNGEMQTYYALLGKANEEFFGNENATDEDFYGEAETFISDIMPSLVKRVEKTSHDVAEENAKKGFFGRLGNVGYGIAMSVPGVVTSIAEMANTALGNPTDDLFHLIWSETPQIAYQETQKEIEKAYKNEFAKTIASGFWEIAYNRGRSAAVGAVYGPMFGGISGAPGWLSNTVHAFPIATIAANDALQKYLAAGTDPTKAWAIASVTFFSESLTEGIELKHMREAFRAGQSLSRDAFRDWVRSYIPNALSESLGETTNEIAEKMADYYWSEGKGDISNLIEKYTDEGYSDDEALEMAMRDQICECAHVAMISFFYPGMDVVQIGAGQLMLYSDYAKMASQYQKIGYGDVTARSLMRTDRTIANLQNQAMKQYQEYQRNRPLKPFNFGDTAPAYGELNEATKNYQAKQADAEMIALDLVRGDEPTAVTATIASIIDTGNAYQANAAAAALGQNVDLVQEILSGAALSGQDMDMVKTGLRYSMLADGECRKVMQSDAFKNATVDEQASMLYEAAKVDDNSIEIQAQVEDAVHNWRVSETMAELIANGQAEEAVKAQQTAEEAQHQTSVAQEQLEAANAKVVAAKQAVEAAKDEVLNDPGNGMNAMKGALATVKSTVADADRYAQNLESLKQNQAKAEQESQQKTEDATASLRQEADRLVRQKETSENEAKKVQQEAETAKAEEAAKIQAERDQKSGAVRESELRAMAEERADKFGYSGEARDEFIDRYIQRGMKSIQQKADMNAPIVIQDGKVSNTEGWLALGALERKLKVEIRFDDLGDPTVVRGNIRGNVITLNSQLVKSGSMTSGQALIEASLHEITHAFESTKSYHNYSKTVLGILYGKDFLNNPDMQKAIRDKIRDYRAAGIDLTQGGKITEEEGAKREIVADYARKNLALKESVDRFMDAGLGGQMRNTLHNINQAIRNFVDGLTGEDRTKAENLRKAERAYQKALTQLAKTSIHPTGEQFSISQFAQAAGLTFNEAEQTLTDAAGNIIDGVTNHVLPEMIEKTPVGRLLTAGKALGTVSEEKAAKIQEQFAKIMDMCAKYRNSDMIWEIGAATLSSEFSAIKGNSDKQYSTTVDFGTICTKTQAIVDQLSRNMLKLGKGLSVTEILQVYNDVTGANLTVPCPVCYVFSRWMGVPSLLGSMKKYQDDFLGKQDDPVSKEEAQRRVDKFLKEARENDKIQLDDKFWETVAKTRSSLQAKIDDSRAKVAAFEAKVADKESVLEMKRLRGRSTKQAESQLETAKRQLEEQKKKTEQFQADYDNAETEAFAKPVGKLKADLESKQKKVLEKLDGTDKTTGLRQRTEDAKRAGQDTSEMEEQLKALYAEYDSIQEELNKVDAYNWVTQALCRLTPDGKFVIDEAFTRTADEILLDLNRTAEFAKDKKNWRYRTTRGAGMGKAILPYSGASIGDSIWGVGARAGNVVNSLLAYNDDPKATESALVRAQKKAKAQNLLGGQRFQSTSDFRPEWGLDYIMTFIEQQAIGSTGQLYTKVAEAVPMLAKAGIDCNLSVMPFGDGYHVDENGNIVLDYSDVTGMNYQTAVALKNQYDNVQLILVGINDTHILAALKDGDIDFVIPWHSSGNSKGQLTAMMNSVGEQLNESSDYTKLQSDALFPGENALLESAKAKLETGEKWTPQEKAAIDRELNRNVRKKILTGGFWKTVKGEKQLVPPTAAEMDAIKNSEYLRSLYYRFYEDKNSDCYQVELSGSQASQIFPFEYWATGLKYDKGTDSFINDPSMEGATKDTADTNGTRFCDYCSQLGYIPRFSGMEYTVKDENGKVVKNEDGTDKKATYGNFSGMTMNEDGTYSFNPVKGYWKLLIDRSMYGLDGNYRSQQKIDATGVDVGEMVMGEDGQYHLTGSDLSRMDINPEKRSRYQLTDPAVIEAHRKASEAFDKRMGLVRAAYYSSYQFSVYDDAGVTDADIDQMVAMDEQYMAAVEAGDMETAQALVDQAAQMAMPQSKNTGEENTIYINDGHLEDGSVVDFANAILDGRKKGETRTHKSLTRKWVGIAKDGQVIGRVRFGDPIVLEKGTQEYEGSMIEGTEYDIEDGETKYYYPVEEIMDLRDNPRPVTRNGNYGQYQFKSNEAVTYDDEGNVIPLSERFNTESPDIRYSAFGDLTDADVDQMLANDGFSQEEVDAFKSMPGNQMDQEAPTDFTPTGPQRQFGADTAQRIAGLSQTVKNYLKKHSDYNPDTNDAQINRAVEWLVDKSTEIDPEGFWGGLEEVESSKFNPYTADGQAKMYALMALAANKSDTNVQLRLADAINKQGTTIGQALQARKLFRLMTPEGRMSVLKKQVDALNIQMQREGKPGNLALTDWIYKAAASAQTEEEYSKVKAAAEEELSRQIPANWKDKLQAWRYLAMLGNPRTHVRNVMGNFTNVPLVGMKNKVAALIESKYLAEGDRTKSLRFVLPKEIKDFTAVDFEKMKDVLTGEAKFKEGGKIRPKPFAGFIQTVSDGVSTALEKEDLIFLKGHYRRALGGWMDANGYTPEQLHGDQKLLDAGRAYAISEAQKATYRDYNELADRLNKLTQNPQTMKGKAGAFLVNAALPFKRTPMNIMARGLEYSPIGLAKSVVDYYRGLTLWQDYQSGKYQVMPLKAVSPSQLIDEISAGLTGTAVMAFGAMLGRAGILTAGLGDDDDEFEKAKGAQPYSINLGFLGIPLTFTLDWAVPGSMPLFSGVVLNEFLSDDNGISWDDMGTLVNSLGNILEPVFNLSMLDGINTLFKTSQNDDSTAIGQILTKIGMNYATSLWPSIFGGAARTIDDTRRKAFVESGHASGPEGTIRYSFEQFQNKVPFWSKSNIPYRDVWGNAEKSGLGKRLLENFVLPGYAKEYKQDFVTNESARLYQETGATSLIPKYAGKTIGTHALTDQEWDTYHSTRGQTAYQVLDALYNSEYYQDPNLDDADRVELVKGVWSFANDKGKLATGYGTDKIKQWVRDTDDPEKAAQHLIDEMETEKQEARNEENVSNAVTSFMNKDYEGYEAMREALRQGGYSDDKLKDKIAASVRDDYKEAYLEGDIERMSDIEDMLDNSGFDFSKSYPGWKRDAKKKQKQKQEEEPEEEP